jgi:ABC-type transport system involved in multi-copper enzyme maturation permease subunit
VSTAVIIARASLAEHSRRRLTLFFLLASIVLTTPLVYLARSPDAQQLVDTPRGLAALASLGILRYLALFAALATSMGNIGRPFASGEAATILARPVARWQFALGRLLGSASFVVGFCLVLTVETTVIQLISGGELMGLLWLHWATVAFNLIVVVAIATVISAVFSNAVIVAITTFFTYVTITGLAFLHNVIATGAVKGRLARFIDVAWVATPKLLVSPLEVRLATSPDAPQAVTALQNSPGLIAAAVVWVVGLALAAMWLTSRKEA